METKMTLTAVALATATAAVALFAAPQGANAMSQLGDSKQVTKSSVEQAGYRYYRHRHWRNRHYYGPRRYYRRPGFGVYLGF